MMQHPSPLLHTFTVDVEEHFHAARFDSPMRRRHWNHFESRVEASTEKLLNLLASRKVKATFFVLGWLAERHPSILRRIASEGHEVACLGYSHELVTAQTPALFRNDVRRGKQVLEDLIGQPVLGYRAPSFTITADTQWALPILVEEGFVYDSSIFPIRHDLYGMPGENPWMHQRDTDAGPLWEIPPSTACVGGARLPIAGGGYLRLLHYPVLRRLLRGVQQAGKPLVLYVKSWELDPNQPRMSGPWASRFRQYVNLHKTEGRVLALLDDFRFGPIREAITPIRERYGRPVTQLSLELPAPPAVGFPAA